MATLPESITGNIAGAVSGDNEPPELLRRPEKTGSAALEEAELMADPRVMDRGQKLSASEIVGSIKSGNPIGLEHLTLGATSTGEPAAVYLDDFGRVQHHVLSTSQWMGIKESRSLNRSRVAQHQQKQEKLNKQRNELRGSFEDGLQHLVSEPFKALLKQKFEEDPQNAVEMLVKWRRLDQQDQDAADRLTEQVMQQQASMTALGQIKTYQASLDKDEQDSLNRYNAGVNDPDMDASAVQAQRNNESRKGALQRSALSHAPAPNSSMLPPNLAMNPAALQGALKDWLPLIDNMVPHPSDDNYATILIKEVLPLLNEVAGSVGWQVPMDELALPDITNAIYKHRKVHGEAIEIQTLRDENEKLKAEIEIEKSATMPSWLTSRGVTNPDAKDPAVIQSLESQHAARGTQITEAESMDLDKSGTVDIWERGDAPDERDVKDIEDRREHVERRKQHLQKAHQREQLAQQIADMASMTGQDSISDINDRIYEIQAGASAADIGLAELLDKENPTASESKMIKDWQSELKLLEEQKALLGRSKTPDDTTDYENLFAKLFGGTVDEAFDALLDKDNPDHEKAKQAEADAKAQQRK